MNNFNNYQNGQKYSNIKIEYHNPLDSGRIVSQTYPHPSGKAPTQVRKIITHVGNSFPQIAIGNKPNSLNSKEVLLVNGCWDTSNKIPNIIAEMHNVGSEDLDTFQQFKNDIIINDTRDLVSPSPRGSDSGIESDCTDGNLSWLLNYKIHELPPVPDSASTETLINTPSLEEHPPVKLSNDTPTMQVVQIQETQDATFQNNDKPTSIHRYSGPKKPPFTYTELIEHALSEKGELTVSGIYQWISDHFPFYKQNDDRWKNSVRHNLSINPHFRKGGKAVHGAGHLWTIAQKDDKKTWQIKQRMQQFLQHTQKDAKTPEQEAFEKELQAATESILGEIQAQTFVSENQSNQQAAKNPLEVEYINLAEGPNGLEVTKCFPPCADFLAPPVSKQEIVNECGLGSDFFITDINPNALGLNLAEAEAIAEDGMYDEMTFDYYELKE